MITKGCSVYERTNAPIQEAYRALGANIAFCGYGKEAKTLAITSCNPGEGKTATAINLCISAARSGKSVLLIDADLRKPQAVKRLGGNTAAGLSDVIAGCAVLEEVINITNIENFHFIGCGAKPLNPTETLSSQRFSEMLDMVRQKYEMVIFDTPPLGSVVDCAIIAAQTDGTVLVVKSRTVPIRSVRQAKTQLEKANARLLGAVLNKVPVREYKSLYKYYNYCGNTKQYNSVFGWLSVFAKNKC